MSNQQNIHSDSGEPVRNALMPSKLLEAARELAPLLASGAAERDRTRTLPLEQMRLLRDSKLPTARVDRAFGGPDIALSELGEIIVQLSAGDPNVAQAIQSHFFLSEQLRLDATVEQRGRYMGAMMDGAMFANAFAERGTKLVGDIRSTLLRDGNRYRLNGTKFFCTGSLFADFLFAGAVLDDGIQAVAIFPRDRQGVRVVDDWDGMGQRTTASGTTTLENVLVESDEIIPLPHVTQRRTYIGAAAQFFHAAIDVGIAKAAVEDAINYAPKARAVPESGVQRAMDDVYVLHALGEMVVTLHASEAMLSRAGVHLDRAVRAQLIGHTDGDLERMLAEASIAVAEAKAFANGACLQICEMMYRVGGASMTLGSLNFDRHWRNARTHTTHDPVAYKYKAVGQFHLTGRYPDVSLKI